MFSLLIVTVTKLREHWEETNAKVMQRKAQLDALLVDSQRYEAKRQEVESWLTRMEARLERMGPVGHTADVLEAQLREQKVILRVIGSMLCIYISRKKCHLAVLVSNSNWTWWTQVNPSLDLHKDFCVHLVHKF
jgi:hypothetical protein